MLWILITISHDLGPAEPMMRLTTSDLSENVWIAKLRIKCIALDMCACILPVWTHGMRKRAAALLIALLGPQIWV
jgi:hypothetical protein